MIDLLDYVPIAAAGFAVPQFLPQIRKLRTTGDSAGVSPSWAALTSVNNAAWIAYFTMSRYWTALIPSCSVTLLAGTLAVMLLRRRRPGPRPAALIAAWAITLAAAGAAAGRPGLGALLTAAFLLQVTPSLWTAYRTARPTGISPGTWLLILGELTCWMIFGLHAADPRLITLGASGIIASTLMLARIHQSTSSAAATFRNLRCQKIEASLIIPDSLETRTLRTPPEGDHDDRLAGRSRPNRRSGRLGHNI